GSALNVGLEHSTAPFVAYLPSDDVLYPGHLTSLLELLEGDESAVAAFSGVRHQHGRDESAGTVVGVGLQLVQVLQRRTPDRWLEREELVTDDLELMLWSTLRTRGTFVGSSSVTCEWIDHPLQRHKLIRESLGGGLNVYRRRFRVLEPLRFQSSEGELLDEVDLYRRFRERPGTDPDADGLKILLVGELAYNPERVLALEERGHRLFGLWTPDGVGFNSVGPVPFGHVEDVPLAGWEEAVRRIRPDVIYALLNWQAISFAHHVLTRETGIPFVWHLKESPQAALERGLWPQLVDLHLRSDAQIFTSQELLAWYESVLPDSTESDLSLVLDGDLPKADWFDGVPGSRLSERDGEAHTVCVGRPFGIFPDLLAELATHGVHTHFHGPTWGDWWAGWMAEARRLAPGYVHLHPTVWQPEWVKVLSRYDAGWLHLFRSRNGGDIRRASWDDLNLPARLGTYAVAGLPLLQPDHGAAVVATQTLARDLGVGVFLRDAESFASELHDEAAMEHRRQRMGHARHQFAFDRHADALVALFRRAIAARESAAGGRRSGHPRASGRSPAAPAGARRSRS
ncbi:MAG: glycosyltransferase family 2 protein, partial [Actinobacteria bacterium]|nr:glycosyltransferase family 2 protein [Actinomycetota bacterium]